MQYYTDLVCLAKSMERVFPFHQVFLQVCHTLVMRSFFELLLVFFCFEMKAIFC